MADSPAYAAYKRRLHRILAFYILALIAFLLLMAWAEQSGLSRRWLGPIFLFSTVMMYGGIGIYGRINNIFMLCKPFQYIAARNKKQF